MQGSSYGSKYKSQLIFGVQSYSKNFLKKKANENPSNNISKRKIKERNYSNRNNMIINCKYYINNALQEKF